MRHLFIRHPVVTACCAAALLAVGAYLIVKPPAPLLSLIGVTQGRVPTRPYLNMPDTVQGKLPRLLSETGAFTDVRRMIPARGLLPYNLILPSGPTAPTKPAMWRSGRQGDVLRQWRLGLPARHGVREDIRIADRHHAAAGEAPQRCDASKRGCW